MNHLESTQNISRSFKGIWIPREVWLDKRLSYFEKCLLSEIHSLDNEHGCHASNKYLMEFFEEKERTIQCGLTKLKSLGYIRYENFDGRIRTLRSNLYPDKSIFNTPDPQDSAPLTSKILHPSLIGGSIEPDNKGYNKDKKNPPLPPPNCRPEGSEDLRKKMISLGWTEEEFGKAWEKYLSYGAGEIKNVEKWLVSVMRSIRLDGEKSKVIQNKQEKVQVEKKDTEKRLREEALLKEKETKEIINNNKNYINIVKESAVERGKLGSITDSYVQLKGCKSPSSELVYNFCIDYDDPNFIEIVENHLLS